MNKIPLYKKFKWRVIIATKEKYGNLSDSNKPSVTNGLMNFPINDNGNPTTFTSTSKPYAEASIGFVNKFKI